MERVKINTVPEAIDFLRTMELEVIGIWHGWITEVEKVLRSFALLEARRLCREVYVIQKDKLRMAAEDAHL